MAMRVGVVSLSVGPREVEAREESLERRVAINEGGDVASPILHGGAE